MNKTVLIMDFGGRYSQLLIKKIRNLKVYCEIIPYTYTVEMIQEKNPACIILSGDPKNVHSKEAPKCDEKVFELGIPILGLCYGAQIMTHMLEGVVGKSTGTHLERKKLKILSKENILKDLQGEKAYWVNCGNQIEKEPKGFEVLAKVEDSIIAMENNAKKQYILQFCLKRDDGYSKKTLENFLYNISKLKGEWDMEKFVEDALKELKETIGEKKALCALSGGVDSSVAAVLVSRAIGENLTCVFVDHGFLRKDEGDQVEAVFKDKFNINLIRVNAQKRFLNKVKGVTDPEQKRKIIGEEFIRVFEEEKEKLGQIDYLVQGTIYSDVMESGTDEHETIKSHHNVGGLPEDVDFKLIEPLRKLFKDEVREVGRALDIPSEIVDRQPFPGPGLAIRVIGEITEEKLEMVREADYIFRDEIEKAGLQSQVWQYFAALTNLKSVGILDNKRSYLHAIALRAVVSVDGTTSEWAKIPHAVLENTSKRIVDNVKGVNRVLFDITSKPPSTIEYE